jgi:hypothetical protein
MLGLFYQLKRKPKKVRHLEDEDRDFILFLLSLKEDEFKMMLNSMTEPEAMVILNNIQLAREELFDDMMEKEGMKAAEEVIKRIKKL